ncbi:MAG: HAMP domain-containing sensor histidine kinase [Hyphomicrobium sp.]
MPADGPRALPQSTESGPEQALLRCRGPAWVIDPAKGRVLAANSAGAARLGLCPDAASGTLDAAMPGLIRLRAMAHEPLNGGKRESLVFWTAYGAENLLCSISAVAQSGAPPLVLVTMVNEDQDVAATYDASPSTGISAAADDAATLKKIASAVRGGFGGRKDQHEEPTAELDEDEEKPAASSPDHTPNVSKLAHELRTPLSAIAVAAEIMKDERFGKLPNARYRGYAADIHSNAHHALAVISRLLSDAPEATTNLLETVELDLNAIAKGSVSAMRPLAEEAKLKLRQKLHTRLPRVVGDAIMVKQILFNLLANAIKFTEPGGEVRVVTGLGYDQAVFVAVRDSGPGMSADEIKRALDASSPPKPERKAAGGLGIGLPLALSLAKANGARLEIDSAAGEGTAVALIFPKERVAAR